MFMEAGILGHVLSTIGAQPIELHAVVTWFVDLCHFDTVGSLSI